MIEVDITGGAQLRRLAMALRKAAASELRKEMRAAQRKAFAGLRDAIATRAAASLPSGYGPTMARSVRVTIRTYFSGPTAVRAVVYAKGRRQHRDVRRINAGALRHPVFGNRAVWSSTRVRPGFASDAAKDLPDEVLAASAEAIERVLQRLGRL